VGIGVQHALNSRSVLSVSYVGNQNRHQNDYSEYNLPDQSVLPALIGGANYSSQPSLPFKGYHSIRLAANEANSHYNGFRLT
jgi:hypothetical protein